MNVIARLARTRAALVLGAMFGAAALGVACGGGPPMPGTTQRGDSTQRAAQRVAGAGGICDTIDRVIVTPTSTRTAFAHDTILQSPMDGKPWRRGCVVAITDSLDEVNAVDTSDVMHLGDTSLEAWFRTNRWMPSFNYQADGPDGETYAYARGPYLCIAEGRWDGGDDSDTTYVPKPGYDLTIKCVGLEPADTVGYGKYVQDSIDQSRPRPIMMGAMACPVPPGCGGVGIRRDTTAPRRDSAPPAVAPAHKDTPAVVVAGLQDVQRLVASARRRSTPWPQQAADPGVAAVAARGRSIAPTIVAMLPGDTATTAGAASANIHIEQHLELALCAIYGITPEAGRTVVRAGGSDAENNAVRRYWRDRVKR